MADIETLLGMGLGRDDDMRAKASALRGQQGLGDWLSLSQVSPIRELGKRTASRAADAAERGGRLRQTIEARRIARENRIEDRTNLVDDRGEGRRYAGGLLKAAQTRDDQLLANENARIDYLADEKTDSAEAVRIANHLRALELAREKEAAKAKYGTDELSSNQLNRSTQKLDKRVQPALQVGESIQEIWDLIAPYGKGGEKEGGNIPGIGLGARSMVARGARALSGDHEGQDIYAAVSELISGTLRKLAGTAQTFTETQNILKGMGADDFADEETAIRSMTRLSESFNREMGRISSGFNDQTVNEFGRNYMEGSSPLDFRIQPVDFGYGAHADTAVPPTPAVGASAIDDELATINAELEAMELSGN